MAIGVIVSPSPCHRWQLARRAAFLLGSPAALTQRAAANGMGSITQDTSAWPMAVVARSCGYMWYQDVPRTIHPSAFSALRFGGPHSHIHIHIIIIILLLLLLPLLLLLILFNPQSPKLEAQIA